MRLRQLPRDPERPGVVEFIATDMRPEDIPEPSVTFKRFVEAHPQFGVSADDVRRAVISALGVERAEIGMSRRANRRVATRRPRGQARPGARRVELRAGK